MCTDRQAGTSCLQCYVLFYSRRLRSPLNAWRTDGAAQCVVSQAEMEYTQRTKFVLILTSCSGVGVMLRRITMGRDGREGRLDLF
jgi:hypothetical protein